MASDLGSLRGWLQQLTTSSNPLVHLCSAPEVTCGWSPNCYSSLPSKHKQEHMAGENAGVAVRSVPAAPGRAQLSWRVRRSAGAELMGAKTHLGLLTGPLEDRMGRIQGKTVEIADQLGPYRWQPARGWPIHLHSRGQSANFCVSTRHPRVTTYGRSRRNWPHGKNDCI